MDIIEQVVRHDPSLCRIATPQNVVYHSECVYTFASPYSSSGGLLVSLQSFIGTSVEALAMQGTEPGGTRLFLRIVQECIPKEEPVEEKELPTQLALGVPGGFALPDEDDAYETRTLYSIVVLKNTGDAGTLLLTEVPYSAEEEAAEESDWPAAVRSSVHSILHHVGSAIQQDLAAWNAADDEPIPVSKYAATLPFVDNGVTIDPRPDRWKCEKTGHADDNLWLNLSDGFIGGGRKHWDGSGGTNGALDHFQETGQIYPLVVKLGTITAETADCYSYAPDEDGPVLVPNLRELLAQRGIQVQALQKTVKSTAELEVELNATYAFDAITEAGTELEPVSGPGFQGLQNLGNSCYMNSVFQMLLSGVIPELAHRYGCPPEEALTKHPLLQTVLPTAAPLDVLCQTCKLASALTSGRFAKPKEAAPHPQYRLAPRMMKHCIGKDHVDFRTAQQQDAAQFLQYFLERLDRAELGAASSLQPLFRDAANTMRTSSHWFAFSTTERRVCTADGKVRYQTSRAPETLWSLRVPMAKATVEDAIGSPEQKKLKSDEAESHVDEKKPAPPVPSIALQTCIEEWASPTTVENVRWSHLQQAVHPALQTVRLTNFPRYLIVQIQRYELGPNWVPIKLEVNLLVPEELDITFLKHTGPSDDEILIPDDDVVERESTAAPVMNEAALAQLMDMGFSLNSCKRALTAVGGNDVEAAMGWVFEHNTDPDFNDPIPDSDTPMSAADASVDEAVVQSLVENLGAFTADQVRAALQHTNGAADRAADWLFSHMDDLDVAMASINPGAASGTETSRSEKAPLEDAAQGIYKLQGMISHIGKNTGSGHYVAHLKDKEGRWVIFNDEKVALSSKPPIEHAYLYLFQRMDTIGSPLSNF